MQFIHSIISPQTLQLTWVHSKDHKARPFSQLYAVAHQKQELYERSPETSEEILGAV